MLAALRSDDVLEQGKLKVCVSYPQFRSGEWSSRRHRWSHQDHSVCILEGEGVLVENSGETTLRSGDCSAFPSWQRPLSDRTL